MARQKKEKLIKINSKKVWINPTSYSVPWNKMAVKIKNIISLELKQYGYEEWLEDDYLSIEGYNFYWKHPNRVAKLALTVSASFGDHPEFGEDGVELYSYSIMIGIENGVNTLTSMHETINDYPEAYSSWINIGAGNIEDNMFDFPNISVVNIPFLIDNVKKLDNRIFFDYDKVMEYNLVEVIHGDFGHNDADFKSWNDYMLWLTFLDVDIMSFAMSKELVNLLPPTVQDIFVF